MFNFILAVILLVVGVLLWRDNKKHIDERDDILLKYYALEKGMNEQQESFENEYLQWEDFHKKISARNIDLVNHIVELEDQRDKLINHVELLGGNPYSVVPRPEV